MKRRENRGKSPRIQNFLRHSVNNLPGVSFYIRAAFTNKSEPDKKAAARVARREERTCQS